MKIKFINLIVQVRDIFPSCHFIFLSSGSTKGKAWLKNNLKRNPRGDVQDPNLNDNNLNILEGLKIIKDKGLIMIGSSKCCPSNTNLMFSHKFIVTRSLNDLLISPHSLGSNSR